MASQLPRHASQDASQAKNRSFESESPLSPVSSQFRIVKSRVHQFSGLSDQANRPEFVNPTKQQRNYVDTPDFRTPPATQSSVFHSCGRHKEQQGQKSRTRTALLLRPSCRRSFSMGHACDKFGLTEIHSSSGRHISMSDNDLALEPHNPTNTYGTSTFANPLAPIRKRQDIIPPISQDTPETEKWRSARDIFTQYDISRPSGWLSDMGDLSLSGDGNASPRRCCRYCHICSTPTWAPTHCSACGHHLCQRCVCEVSSDTPQAHADFSPHASPAITRDITHQASTSKLNLESTREFHRDTGTTRSTSTSRRHDRTDAQQYQSSRHRDDMSWLNRNNGHMTASEVHRETNTPTMRHDPHTEKGHFNQASSCSKPLVTENPFLVRDRKSQEHEMEEDTCVRASNRGECDDPMCKATHAGHHPFRHSVSCAKHQGKERRPVLEVPSTSGTPLAAGVSTKVDSDTSLPSGEADGIHRHHTASFHSSRHIMEHLSSAVGYNAHDLLKHRNEKQLQRTPSPKKADIKRISYLEPLTPAKSVTELGSFQWTPDAVSPGHPGDLNDERHRHSREMKLATSASSHGQSRFTGDKSTHEVEDEKLESAAIHGGPREIPNDSKLSLSSHTHPKLRLTSPPSWLKNPTKEAANATAPLRHISTKSHETHEHEHGYLPSVTVDG
ncbi:hypothetical protein F5Y08DRAFT_352937 [Xylaria arbuscula]|nr:hypothetical protein F5Y08DRAFT_352937 [Xylaria arbuscula]